MRGLSAVVVLRRRAASTAAGPPDLAPDVTANLPWRVWPVGGGRRRMASWTNCAMLKCAV